MICKFLSAVNVVHKCSQAGTEDSSWIHARTVSPRRRQDRYCAICFAFAARRRSTSHQWIKPLFSRPIFHPSTLVSVIGGVGSAVGGTLGSVGAMDQLGRKFLYGRATPSDEGPKPMFDLVTHYAVFQKMKGPISSACVCGDKTLLSGADLLVWRNLQAANVERGSGFHSNQTAWVPPFYWGMAAIGSSFVLKGTKVTIQQPHRWKLRHHPVMRRGKKVLIIILDGWGEQIADEYNGIHVASTPTMDALRETAPDRWRLLRAHGRSVGLPSDEDMGNSEVGHNALGAGRIFTQGAGLVDVALSSGKLYEGTGFKFISEAFAKNTVHFMGLLSDGGVHSRSDQLSLLMKGCAERGAKRMRVHILLDGRDVAPGSAPKYVDILEKDLADIQNMGCDAMIASGGGRMAVTMDRYENDWGVVKKGWDAQVKGEAPYQFSSAGAALTTLKESDAKLNDQYFPPFVIVGSDGKPVGPILDGDAVVTFNFRADRMVMAAQAFDLETFDKFDRGRMPKIKYAGMLQYDADLDLPKKYLVSPPQIDKPSGEYLSYNSIRTWACSETVKFGHVTFIWNGNRSGTFRSSLEKYVQIPSDKGIPFNENPEMKAIEIAEKAKAALLSGKYDHVRVNLANGDMVGHTGDPKATVIACETVDKAVKIMLDAVEEVRGIFLITADHGNAEDMVKRNLKTGAPLLNKEGETEVLTSHTCNPVPCIIGGLGLAKGVRFRKDLPDAGLANIASTFINFHGFHAPWDYEPTLVEYDEKE